MNTFSLRRVLSAIILTMLVSTVTLNQVDAKVIFSCTKSDRGLFGYRVSNWHTATNDSGISGWVGDCHDPGWSGCHPPSTPTDNDAVDEVHIDTLRRFAELKIANGIRSGTETVLVQVSGESFTRHYMVTWTSTDVIRRPTEDIGDGQNMSIIIERNDISL